MRWSQLQAFCAILAATALVHEIHGQAAAAQVTNPESSTNAQTTANTSATAGALTNAGTNPFTGAVIANTSQAESDNAPKCLPNTPAKVVIERVVSYPADGSSPEVVLRNTGGQTANLKGWTLTDGQSPETGESQAYVFGEVPGCDGPANYTIAGGQRMVLKPRSDLNPCGVSFSISFRDELRLEDNAGTLVASIKWDGSEQGTAQRLMPGGTYKLLPEDVTVVDVLPSLQNYSMFLEALQAVGFDKLLSAPSDPAYTGPTQPEAVEEDVVPQFPWWFGFGVDRSKMPPPPPPPPPPPAPAAGIPEFGPYTLLAPNNEAFDALLTNLGGMNSKLPKERFYKLPELKDILLYHIIPGRYTSEWLFNNTPIWTAQASEVVPFTDPCMTEGVIELHDACVDKPTPDQFSCVEQLKFDKCFYPFMTSPLAAQWQGGFCQRSCLRCSCAADSGIVCAKVLIPDVMANNGVVHGISRVLFPPPVFDKSQYATTDGELDLFNNLKDGKMSVEDLPTNRMPAQAGLGQAGLGAGQAGVGAGQIGLGVGQAGVGAGQIGLGAGQAGVGAGQAGVGAGQAGLGVGQAGVGAGQAGVGAGQAGVGAGGSLADTTNVGPGAAGAAATLPIAGTGNVLTIPAANQEPVPIKPAAGVAVQPAAEPESKAPDAATTVAAVTGIDPAAATVPADTVDSKA